MVEVRAGHQGEPAWRAMPILTVGETAYGYRMPGVPDGLALFPRPWLGTVRVYVSHELQPGMGVPYELANGTRLTGARVSLLDLDRDRLTVEGGGLAYHTVYDRQGLEVADPRQINETGVGIDGFARFCSSRGVAAGASYGFVDDLVFLHEEAFHPPHPHGGSIWVLDVGAGELHAAPALGRGSWENSTPLPAPSSDRVALLLGDDTDHAPLYLYVGRKDARGDGSLLDRNGLAVGELFVWKSDEGAVGPEAFPGDGEPLEGTFVPLAARDPARAGEEGHDSRGWRDASTLQSLAREAGALAFSRPEDLHDEPGGTGRVAFASTGGGPDHPTDVWGDLYMIDTDLSDPWAPRAAIRLLHDADALVDPDHGIRNPDNLTWASDGYLYVQEDRHAGLTGRFGASSGQEASVWRVDPETGAGQRLAVVARNVVVPTGTVDVAADVAGAWETSGIVDGAGAFELFEEETLLLLTVQAHSLTGGPIGGPQGLVQGGQILYLTNAQAREIAPAGLRVLRRRTLAWVLSVAALFTLTAGVCVLTVPFGLPGSWMILGLAIVIELLDRLWLGLVDDTTFGWKVLAFCAGLGFLGEILEAGAGALGAKTTGSSRSGMVGALLGGILGAIAGTFIPLPAVGTLAGAVIGTFLGAVVGEMRGEGGTFSGSLGPATGATVGRILGTAAKIPVAALIWLVLSVAAFWP